MTGIRKLHPAQNNTHWLRTGKTPAHSQTLSKDYLTALYAVNTPEFREDLLDCKIDRKQPHLLNIRCWTQQSDWVIKWVCTRPQKCVYSSTLLFSHVAALELNTSLMYHVTEILAAEGISAWKIKPRWHVRIMGQAVLDGKAKGWGIKKKKCKKDVWIIYKLLRFLEHHRGCKEQVNRLGKKQRLCNPAVPDLFITHNKTALKDTLAYYKNIQWNHRLSRANKYDF